MIRIFYLLIFIFFIFSKQSIAQSDLSESQVKELNELGVHIEGTFQIQLIDTRSKPSFELILYDVINKKRDLTQNVYHVVNPSMRILILPKEVIERTDFVSIQRVKYISSKETKHDQ